jgi:hypothetical protein
MNIGGVATASPSGSRSQSKRERSRSSKIASPSSTRARADSFAIAAAVDLLFEGPAIAVEQLTDPRGRHRRVFRQHERSFYPHRQARSSLTAYAALSSM